MMGEVGRAIKTTDASGLETTYVHDLATLPGSVSGGKLITVTPH